MKKVFLTAAAFLFALPFFVSAQSTPPDPKAMPATVAASESVTTEPTLPAFMKDVKSQADFDKLKPAQKKEMEAYLTAKAMADADKMTPEERAGKPAARTVNNPEPTPAVTAAPAGSTGSVKGILFGFVTILFLVALGLIARTFLSSKTGRWSSKSFLLLGLALSGVVVSGGEVKAAAVSTSCWYWNGSTFTVSVDKSTYAPGDTVTARADNDGSGSSDTAIILVNFDHQGSSVRIADPLIIGRFPSSASGTLVVPVLGAHNVYFDLARGGKTAGHCSALAVAVVPAPINGGWSAWSPVACPASGGVNQTRTCTNPAPANGGANCSGASSQYCPVPLPTASVSVSPDPVPNGGNPGFTINTTNAMYCQVALDGAANIFTQGFFASGTYNPGPISTAGSHSAWVNCYNSDWVSSGWSTTNFTVNSAPAPTVTLQAFNSATITTGQTSTISFSSTDATSCSGTGPLSGDLGATSATNRATPVMNTVGTFNQTVTCTGPGGSVSSGTQTLTVNPSNCTKTPPNALIRGSDVNVKDPISASYISDLRKDIDTIYNDAYGSNFAWGSTRGGTASETLSKGAAIRAADFLEMRDAVDKIYQQCHQTAYGGWTDDLAAGKPIRAAHVNQIREALKNAK